MLTALGSFDGRFGEYMAETRNVSVCALRAGFLCRCPKCGRGRLYSGYLQVAEHCNVCNLELRQHDASDGPAVFVVLIVGAVIVAWAMWVELAYQPPNWVHLVIWAPMIFCACLVALRPAKAILVVLQYKHKVLDFDQSS